MMHFRPNSLRFIKKEGLNCEGKQAINSGCCADMVSELVVNLSTPLTRSRVLFHDLNMCLHDVNHVHLSLMNQKITSFQVVIIYCGVEYCKSDALLLFANHASF